LFDHPANSYCNGSKNDKEEDDDKELEDDEDKDEDEDYDVHVHVHVYEDHSFITAIGMITVQTLSSSQV
jgi:hypothetical protein